MADASKQRLKAITFRLEPDILAGLALVRARDGIPVTEQVRRALLAWLKSQRVELDVTTKRRR